jgi:uncharacterized membrane protein YedE/YeeE
MFDSLAQLLLGLITGIAFGFLLQKGRAAKYRVILGQLLLRDWTVAKIMGTAVAVGAVGVWALVLRGEATLHVKSLQLGGIIVGGIIFGIGMAVFGYCPGTGVAACGEGRRDAMMGAMGMLCGASAYVALYPLLQPLMEKLGDRGKATLPGATDTSPWIWIAGLLLATLTGIAVDRLRRGKPPFLNETHPKTPRGIPVTGPT